MSAGRLAQATPLALAAAVPAVLAAVEWSEGRPPLCPCGRLRLWTGMANGPETSQMAADWYSLSHIVHGLIFYAVLALAARRLPVAWRLTIAALVEAGWELAENSPAMIARYRAATVAVGYSGDSIVNSVSDVAMTMLGFAVAERIPARASILLALALELASLAAIRDDLTLNVLMLAHPIETVRRWQAG